MPGIDVQLDMHAPPSDRWYAHFGDLDYDSVTGHGPTPLAAIADLLDQVEPVPYVQMVGWGGLAVARKEISIERAREIASELGVTVRANEIGSVLRFYTKNLEIAHVRITRKGTVDETAVRQLLGLRK